jgi:hypothetical protein
MEKVTQLTINDLLVIKESLQYTTYNIENSENQAPYEQKQDKLNRIASVRDKISQLIKENRK